VQEIETLFAETDGNVLQKEVVELLQKLLIKVKKAELRELIKAAKESKLLKSNKEERNEKRQELIEKLQEANNENELFFVKEEFLKTKEG